MSLTLIIVLLSHTLIYFLMPWDYNYQQEKALEMDAARLVEQITIVPAEERLNCVMDFATKWTANVSVDYEGFTYHMDLLKAEIDTAPSPDGRVEVTIIASTIEVGLKISLAENPLGGADFFKVEQGFADGPGSITAAVSRQHIEDSVSAVLMILPFTAILCAIISFSTANGTVRFASSSAPSMRLCR